MSLNHEIVCALTLSMSAEVTFSYVCIKMQLRYVITIVSNKIMIIMVHFRGLQTMVGERVLTPPPLTDDKNKCNISISYRTQLSSCVCVYVCRGNRRLLVQLLSIQNKLPICLYLQLLQFKIRQLNRYVRKGTKKKNRLRTSCFQ